MMRETLQEEMEHSYRRHVQQVACDKAAELLLIALGSLKDSVTDARIAVRADRASYSVVEPLEKKAATELGMRVYRDAIDSLWEDLPFTCAGLVKQCDPDAKLGQYEDNAIAFVEDFLKFVKPCTK